MNIKLSIILLSNQNEIVDGCIILPTLSIVKKHRLSEKTYKRIRKEKKINLALTFKGSSLASAM